MWDAYYNENDPYAADWLENLIAAGHIADGVVDRRSIEDVRPDDLRGFRQCHFFAGVGVWSLALRRAGVPDDTPIWTGSCPCQPFSAAGKGAGLDDKRHLWPHWFHLIREHRPSIAFGEQVSSKDGLAWLDLVQADMEGEDYAFGALDTCAAGVGAPHIRQRLYFAAERPGSSDGGLDYSASARHERQVENAEAEARHEARVRLSDVGRALGGLANANGRDPSAERIQRGEEYGQQQKDSGAGGLANAAHVRWGEECPDTGRCGGGDTTKRVPAGSCASRCDIRPGPTNGLWRDVDWLFCRDDKWRPVEPGTFPLADGAPARVGRLRAYGNAINVEQARIFIESYFEAIKE